MLCWFLTEPQLGSGAKLSAILGAGIFEPIPQLSVPGLVFGRRSMLRERGPWQRKANASPYTAMFAQPCVHQLGGIAFLRAYQDRLRVYYMTLQQLGLRCEA
jgi:hypothetical protein